MEKTIHVTLEFDRKKRWAVTKQEQPIEVRVNIGKSVRRFPTGVKVRAGEWRQGQVINRLDAVQLNERISIIVRKVQKRINEQLENQDTIDLASIRLDVDERLESAFSFIEFVCDRATKRNVSVGTMRRYEVFIRGLRRYGRLNRFSDLTSDGIMEFDAWLHSRNLTDATIYNYHKELKLFIGEAIVMGKMTDSPYTKIPKTTISRGDKPSVEYLTIEEMRKIEQVDLPTDVLRRARDLFVFQMYTGLSFTDMATFDFRDYEQRDGVYMRTGIRHKTKVAYTIVLLPAALAVVEKYGNVLPVPNNADYNHQLKEVAAYAHIRKRVHSHLARHTFATYMLSQGCTLPNVSRMLGHSNTIITQRYAKTLAESVVKDFAMVAEQQKRTPR